MRYQLAGQLTIKSNQIKSDQIKSLNIPQPILSHTGTIYTSLPHLPVGQILQQTPS